MRRSLKRGFFKMKKIDATIWKETAYIGAWTLIFSVLMQAVYLVIGKWDYTVLLGNLLGILTTVGNFFLLGVTVQKALDMEPDDAKKAVKLSQSSRLIMMFLVALAAYFIPVFNIVAVIIPYLFPRIAIMFRSCFNKGVNDVEK